MKFKDPKNEMRSRIYVLYFLSLIFGVIVLVKASYIQLVQGEELREKAEKQEMRYFQVEAVRGTIYSADGIPLATSVPLFDIAMDVRHKVVPDSIFLSGVDSLAYCLANTFRDKTKQQYKQILLKARAKERGYVLLQKNVKYDVKRQVERFPIFRLGKNRGGLIADKKYRRELIYGDLGRRTIGFIMEDTKDSVALGIESAFDQDLRGSKGLVLKRRIAGSAWRPVKSDNEIEPKNGCDVITTIDFRMQDVADNALRKELIADSADYGCVILMEVRTGHIKAIINLAKNKQGQYVEGANYAINDRAEPGSTFKLASFLIALEFGGLSLHDKFNTGNGKKVYYRKTVTDAHGGYGVITAQQIFEKSSNVGTSEIVRHCFLKNPEKFTNGLRNLFVHDYELQIKGEQKPFINSPKEKRTWSAESLHQMGYGYETLLTPMHMLILYNAVANNGKMMRPLLVSKIRRAGQTIKVFEPEVINPAICSMSTIDSAHKLLEGVVSNGTAKTLFNTVYQIAGKTGTAKVADADKGYDVPIYKASFVGYFPADNPKYSCIVVVTNPTKGKYYGGAVSAPVFKEIADKVYAMDLEINKRAVKDSLRPVVPFAPAGYQNELTTIYETLNFKVSDRFPAPLLVRSEKKDRVVSFQPFRFSNGYMPDLIGLTARDALYLLEKMGLKVRLSGKGNVIKQSVPAGTKISKGNLVQIQLQT
ncbi:MAG: PASTA domain-containing protein [Bacteroidetes bacterium]|nr:PASTA domain-containing protein [Bacteroidota bacterium]